MKSIVGASYIREGKLLVGRAVSGESRLFGRVINVMFIRKSGKTFCIRSDYEPRYHSNGGEGTVEFVPCSQKPSITVTYAQKANSVSTEVSIRVDSLYIDREIDGESIDSTAGDPVVWAVLQMGYIDQFPDWRKIKAGDDVERFYDLNNNSVTTEQDTLGGKQMLVLILNCGPESLPPERTWLFNGVVGTMENGLKWNHPEGALTKANYGDPNFPKKSEIEAVLYQWITRRFVRASVRHKIMADQKVDNDGNTAYTREVYIYGYRSYFDGTVVDKEYTKLDLSTNNGLMTVDDANMFGATCSCSKFLQEKATNDLYYYGTVGKVMKEAGIKMDQSVFAEPFDGIGPQLEAIRRHYPYLRWYMLHDGTFFFYHVDEPVESIFSDPFIREMQVEHAVLLPAVYDITTAGTVTIRCPFTNLIDPTTTLLFSSRYNILGVVGFYAQPEQPLQVFLAQLVDVAFSTVGDTNTMTIMCTPCPNGQMPLVNVETGTVQVTITDGAAEGYTDNVQKQEDEKSLSWAPVTITIGEYPFDKAQYGWLDVANNLLRKNLDVKAWADTPCSMVRVLSDLRDWNGSVWTNDRMKDSSGRSSPENRLVKDAGFTIPWLCKGDKVVVKLPYKPSYDDNYKKKSIEA